MIAFALIVIFFTPAFLEWSPSGQHLDLLVNSGLFGLYEIGNCTAETGIGNPMQ